MGVFLVRQELENVMGEMNRESHLQSCSEEGDQTLRAALLRQLTLHTEVRNKNWPFG